MLQKDPFSPEALQLPDAGLQALSRGPSKRPPRHQPGERFLKGPIPWSWLQRAGRLPGRALQVAILLWKEAGCRKCRTVPFCLARATELGTHPSAARRGLKNLTDCGLVSVRQRPGCCSEVTLLDATAELPSKSP